MAEQKGGTKHHKLQLLLLLLYYADVKNPLTHQIGAYRM